MLLKTGGLILIVCSGIGIGQYYACMLGKRMKSLKSLQKMAVLLRGEIAYGKQSLPDAFLSIASKSPDDLGEVLKRTAQRMKEARGESLLAILKDEAWILEEKAGLCREDTEAFLQLGSVLGFMDRETQIRNLNLYEEEIQRLIEEQQCVLPQKKKMYRTLGIMGGLFLAVLLI